MCARARAALDGRPEVDVEDIKAMAAPVLRHRLVLNYNAESQGQTPETVVKKLIENIPLHASARESHGRIESVLKA
jgi:MoxR-like ATPase